MSILTHISVELTIACLKENCVFAKYQLSSAIMIIPKTSDLVYKFGIQLGSQTLLNTYKN